MAKKKARTAKAAKKRRAGKRFKGSPAEMEARIASGLPGTARPNRGRPVKGQAADNAGASALAAARKYPKTNKLTAAGGLRGGVRVSNKGIRKKIKKGYQGVFKAATASWVAAAGAARKKKRRKKR